MKNATKAELVDAILEELRTKPEIVVNVWADPAQDKKDIQSVGMAKVPLNKFVSAQFQDRQFKDPKTRQTVNYQARVLFEKATLKSAFQKVRGLNVELQMWF